MLSRFVLLACLAFLAGLAGRIRVGAGRGRRDLRPVGAGSARGGARRAAGRAAGRDCPRAAGRATRSASTTSWSTSCYVTTLRPAASWCRLSAAMPASRWWSEAASAGPRNTTSTSSAGGTARPQPVARDRHAGRRGTAGEPAPSLVDQGDPVGERECGVRLPDPRALVPVGQAGSSGRPRCALVGWSTVTVRSLVYPLPING